MSLQFFAGLDKARGDLGEREAQQRAPGGEDEIQAGRDQFLVPAVDLAQAALGAVAVDGVADRGAGGDHTHAGRAGRFRGGTGAPRKQEGAAVHAAALFADRAEFNHAPQALAGAQMHFQTTVRRLRPFLRRAARTLRPPRVALRARKPILRARFLRCGRNVGFIDLWQKEGQIRARGGGVSSERFKGRFAPKTGGCKSRDVTLRGVVSSVNSLRTNSFCVRLASARRWVMPESCPQPTRSPDKSPTSKAPASPGRKGGPLFWTVTGNDFGRSISWAKKQPNAVSEQITTALSSSSKKTK